MPSNEKDYPVSMKNMKKVVRDKAIDIANALKEEKYSDLNFPLTKVGLYLENSIV